MTNITHISNFIAEQFPDFYKSEGPQFIQFMKAYYEWEETRSKSRQLLDLRDIDNTTEEFLSYFQSEYMAGIPKEILGDRRLLQKHILDLYRAKGSNEGLRLFFRLLFNEEIDIYVPSVDIFKLDESNWYEPLYMEITTRDSNRSFEGKTIHGETSRASAIVERYERRSVSQKIIDILFLSNVKGNFIIDENIFYEGIDNINRPKILGSPNSLIILASDPGFQIGEQLNVFAGGNGEALKAAVSSVKLSGSGIIDFVLVDGGFGYNQNSVITIGTGSNTTGGNASFEISEFSNMTEFDISTIEIGPYSNVALDAVNFAVAGGAPTMNTANASTTLEDALSYETISYGSISKLRVLNPGSDYDGFVNVNVKDDKFYSLKIPSAVGNYEGNNAIILGNAIYGNGVIQDTVLIDSGLGYSGVDQIIVLKNESNTVITCTARISFGPLGKGLGYWRTSSSFVDDDKYLQDDDYYQEYSYEIQIRKNLDKYIQILRKVMHPSGNKPFTKTKLITEG